MRPEVLRPRLPNRRHLRELIRFGGWITVSNIVGPFMVYFDRFLVGAIVTMTAVAFYTTPYEVLSRAQLMPQALMGVLFPAFSTAFAVYRDRLAPLYRNTVRVIALVMIPLLAVAFLFAPEGLMLWLGPEFAQRSAPVARWLAAGLVLNVLARPPSTLLQGVGRPDLTAKTHLSELIPYFVLLWVLTERFGIVGAAVAWSIRVTVDSVILNELARRVVPAVGGSVRTSYIIGVVLLSGLAAGLAIQSVLGRGILAVATLGVVLVGFGRPLGRA